jgi:tRNA pseudouridine32 synthase/23S rRNA pseudouridine746 synthase
MTSFFHSFKTDVKGFAFPERFTFPFYYEPHPLAELAAKELQSFLEDQTELNHNFGLDKLQNGLVIGKMFGVLVATNDRNEVGYLQAFSGKLGGKNHHSGFVPPVFDMLEEDGFFRTEERNLTALNETIEKLEQDPDYIDLKKTLLELTHSHQQEIEQTKAEIKKNKSNRKSEREHILQLSDHSEQEKLLEELRKQSIREQYFLKELTQRFKSTLTGINEKLEGKEREINRLKDERRTRSSNLQDRLFDSYSFLNKQGESKSLLKIFSQTADGKTPSGAGECAAPKLLQFAFNHGLKPIALAEFWWGAPPPSEVRVHGQFYPACRGKCEPILGHMLEGMDVDPNPMLDNPAENKELTIIYEDDAILLINKPAEFLSVPGRRITDSVYTRIKQAYPSAEGPLIVHRLDMSTSGIMILAKTLKAYHHLQRQFIQRTIKKRYVALLDGNIANEEGIVELPMRVDLDNRPRQVICFEHGKPALTRWKKINESSNQTRVHFFPETGRTHQLRLHAAHKDGLNCAILGDDLYGKKGERLHLHAEEIEFMHPTTKKRCSFQCAAPF